LYFGSIWYPSLRSRFLPLLVKRLFRLQIHGLGNGVDFHFWLYFRMGLHHFFNHHWFPAQICLTLSWRIRMIIAVPTGVKLFNLVVHYVPWSPSCDGSGAIDAWFYGDVSLSVVMDRCFYLLNQVLTMYCITACSLIAHFHNTIIGGAVFGYLLVLAFLVPKAGGLSPNVKLGKRRSGVG